MRDRIDSLLEITGRKLFEVPCPAEGWPISVIKSVTSPTKDFGKFFLVVGGHINYMSRELSIIAMKNYPPFLMSWAIDSLENEAMKVIINSSSNRKFPRIHKILIKYHGLD